jgi:predicted lipoprotein
MTSKPLALRVALVLSVGAGVGLACGTSACSKSSSTKDAGTGASAAKTAVLTAAANCVYGTYGAFLDKAKALATAATAAAAAPTDAAARTAAQDAWRAAYDVWQEAESFQVGPAALKANELGGDDRRDPIYSWPLVNRCGIEQAIVTKAYASPDFASALVNVKGLAALEYTLFYTGTDNACAATADINALGSWAALDATELAKRKADFAAVLATDLVTQATTLERAWAPDAGNFVSKLATAGAGSSVYNTDQMGLNALSDGLFYIEHSAKDLKLGRPLGITPCTDATCALTESPYATRSKEALRHNYICFKKIFSGCGADYSGQGFDDLLVGVGATDLATQMSTDLGAIFSAIDALGDQTLEEAMVKDKAKVRAIYDAMKVVTNDLRSQFIGILDLELPKSVEGDND